MTAKPKEPIRVGDKMRTRDGSAARIICVDQKGRPPIVALVENSDGREILFCYDAEGRFSQYQESGVDLFPLPKKVTVWIVLRAGGIATAYTDEPLHVKDWVNEPRAVYKLELEEGHFDV